MNNGLMGIPARLLLCFALPLSVAWVAWETGPDLPLAKLMRFPDEQWSLAQAPSPDLKKVYEYLSVASIWGNVEVVKKEDEERDPAWRFLAILNNGTEKIVVLDVEKQPNRQLKVGDKLPGGAKIHAIRHDSLCVIVNGKKRLLPIFPQDRQIL